MKKGFTLIELLVVVLIIGILAAIALPQYTKAVEKSRAAEAYTNLKAIIGGQEIYYMTHNKYTSDLTELDIEVPESKNFSYENREDCFMRAIRKNDAAPYEVHFYFAHPAVGEPNARICHYGGKDKGKEICKSLGCKSDEIHEQFCVLSSF
ncbi:type IV pilus assembly protein PilE [Elusimicrobium posterum]|uniref:type IV pilin protein n=1 Tax=Elusimicrobium posterum TaxID=3116653 RepID=UPI003C735F39